MAGKVAGKTMLPAPGILFDPASAAVTTEIDAGLSKSIESFPALTLPRSLLLISPPKAGTHVFRNILWHFFAKSMHEPFIFDDEISQALKDSKSGPSTILISHMAFAPERLLATHDIIRLLLIRDPVSHLVSLARDALANKSRADFRHFQENLSLEETIEKQALGYHVEGYTVWPFHEFYRAYCLDWAPHSDLAVFTEDFFSNSQSRSQEILPAVKATASLIEVEWKEDYKHRIIAGCEPKISATFVPPLDLESRARAFEVAHLAIHTLCPEIIDAYESLRISSQEGFLAKHHLESHAESFRT